MYTLERFKEMIATATVEEEIEADSKVFVVKDVEEGQTFDWIEIPYCGDFNLEINHAQKTFGVRCDEDFHICARLPYGFRDLKIEEVVNALWPKLVATRSEKISYLPNSEYSETGRQMTEHWRDFGNKGMKMNVETGEWEYF